MFASAERRVLRRLCELVALYHQRGIIESEEFTAKGTLIQGKIAARLVPRFERYLLS